MYLGTLGREETDRLRALSGRVSINCECVHGAVIQAIPLFKSERNGIQSAFAQKTNGSWITTFVPFLCPMHQRITGSHDRFRGDDRLNRVFAVVTQLVID